MTQLFDPAKEPYVSLITFRKNGIEVATAVWVAKYNDAYYIFSESKAGKVKRLRNNPKIRMAACDVRGKISSDWHNGTATLISDEKEIKEMYKAFDKKYGWQIRSLNFAAKLTGRIKKRAIIRVTLS